jgi:hypothetical protein
MQVLTRSRLTSALPSMAPFGTDRVSNDLVTTGGGFTMPRIYTRRSESDRFWEKVNKNGPIPSHRPELGPCWLWTAAPDSHGYSTFFATARTDGVRRMVTAYRWGWEQEHGPVPSGLELDHLCRTRACVRHDHLEAVTGAVNRQRGRNVNREKISCRRGHPYDEANTYHDARGTRHCRACNRDAVSRYKNRFER